MTVVIINPNSSDVMTASALEAARHASPDVEFVAWTSEKGPRVIEGPEDGAEAVPPLLDLVQQANDLNPTAIIISCFDDTGLREAQDISSCPVLGIGQASFIYANMMAGRTAVITTVEPAVPVITANIEQQGFEKHVRDVIAANVPVITLSEDPDTALEKFLEASKQLPEDTQNIILGCSGAVTIKGGFEKSTYLNVIDGVFAAARLCRSIASE